MLEVAFSIPGTVVPWARAGRGGGFTFTPAKQRNYMGVIRSEAHIAMQGKSPFIGPVEVEMIARFPWPKSTTKKRKASIDGAWKFNKPDIDNVFKILCDSMNQIVYLDDAQISKTSQIKVLDDRPGLRIIIRSLAGIEVPQ